MSGKPAALLASMMLVLVVGVSVVGISAIGDGMQRGEPAPAASETHLAVPFHFQEVEYYCGPAALQMVFDYYGENISQFEIADVARSIGEPVYLTFTDELRRAAHFSNLSGSLGDELPASITGYTLRPLGYAAFEAHDMNLTALRRCLDDGHPLILLMWYSSYHVSTHYRVATGYNGTHVFLHDPWNKPLWGGTYGGPDLAFNNTHFLDLWSFYDNWALYASPWTAALSAPHYIKPGSPFQINFTVSYPRPLPNPLSGYPAASCTASIVLPSNVSFAEGETPQKAIDDGSLEAGANATVSWTLIADVGNSFTMTIEVEGLVSGAVPAHQNYSAYDYTDRVGTATRFTVELDEDDAPPVIGTPSRVPEGDVPPDTEVAVAVIVTDALSGVKSVRLTMNANTSAAWWDFPMTLREPINSTTGLYEYTIPGQPAGVLVQYKITASDYAGNNKTEDNEGLHYGYTVVPEFPSLLILPWFVGSTLLAAIAYRGKRTCARLSCDRWAAIGSASSSLDARETKGFRAATPTWKYLRRE